MIRLFNYLWVIGATIAYVWQFKIYLPAILSTLGIKV